MNGCPYLMVAMERRQAADLARAQQGYGEEERWRVELLRIAAEEEERERRMGVRQPVLDLRRRQTPVAAPVPPKKTAARKGTKKRGRTGYGNQWWNS